MYRAACADCDPCVALWLRCVAKSPAPSWNRRRVCRRSRPDRTAQRTCIATRAGCVSKLGARCPAGSWDSTQTRDNGDESTIYETPIYIHVGLNFYIPLAACIDFRSVKQTPISSSSTAPTGTAPTARRTCHFPPPPPICAETCNWASDADCDDGGPGLGSARPGPTACGRPDHRLTYVKELK